MQHLFLSIGVESLGKLEEEFWGHHSSVDSSAPTISRSQVRIQSIPSMLLYNQILYYICHWIEKRTNIHKKRPDMAHIIT